MERKSSVRRLKDDLRGTYAKSEAFKQHGAKRHSTRTTTAFVKKGVGYAPEYKTLIPAKRKSEIV